MHFQQKIVTEFIDNQSDKVLVVLHGYGQLARYFIKKFDHLIGYDILAIQAPNLFYINGFNGRVGANWMTKENREEAIDTQQRILDAVAGFVSEKYQSISLCGFSQGAATASRWVMWEVINFEKVMLYGGEIAPESYNYFKHHLPKNIKYVVGKDDEFYSEEKVVAYQKKLDSVGVLLKLQSVVGKHSVDKQVVKDYFG